MMLFEPIFPSLFQNKRIGSNLGGHIGNIKILEQLFTINSLLDTPGIKNSLEADDNCSSKFIIINGTKEVKRCEFSTSGLPSEYFKQFTASETFKPSFKWW